jgi:hypothetical protein
MSHISLAHMFGSLPTTISSHIFGQKKFFPKNRPVGDHGEIFQKRGAERDHRLIFRKNFFLSENMCTNAVFCADSEYVVILLPNLVKTMKTQSMDNILTIFSSSAAVVTPTKQLCTSFSLLNNISKDAEFQALSEYIITSVITFVYDHHKLKKLNK